MGYVVTMRAPLPLLVLSSLAACGPKREAQSLAELGQIVVEVPIPSDPQGVGAAFFEAQLTELPPGKEWITPREGITVLCHGTRSGRLEIRVMIEHAQLDTQTGVLEAICPLGDGLPVTIRW